MVRFAILVPEQAVLTNDCRGVGGWLGQQTWLPLMSTGFISKYEGFHAI